MFSGGSWLHEISFFIGSVLCHCLHTRADCDFPTLDSTLRQASHLWSMFTRILSLSFLYQTACKKNEFNI